MKKVVLQKSMKRIFLIVGILTIIVSFIQISNIEAKEIAKLGSPAPDFTAKDLEENKVSISDYKGKVIFLNIWASWCGPCRKEMPSMESLKEEMKDYNFVILAISVDKGETNKVKAFIERNRFTFKVLHDPKKEIKAKYYYNGIPTTYIIDSKGIVVEKSIGYEQWDSKERIKQFKSLSTK